MRLFQMNWRLLALGFVFLGLLAFLIWALLLPAPRTSTTPPPGFDPSGQYVLEKYYDPSLETPTAKVYLGDFRENPALPNPNPWCTPTWYAIRYVRQSDGGYSALGPWSDRPVQAGVEATDLPCPNGLCAGTIASGKGACRYNAPIVGNTEPLHYVLGTAADPVWANLHRRTTPPRYDADGKVDDDEGEVVGRLLPTNTLRLKGWWLDAPAAGKVNTRKTCGTPTCEGGEVPPPAGPCGSVPGAPGLETSAESAARCVVDPEWLVYYSAKPSAPLDAPLDAFTGVSFDTCLASCKTYDAGGVRCGSIAAELPGKCVLYPRAPHAYASAGPNDIGAVLRSAVLV